MRKLERQKLIRRQERKRLRLPLAGAAGTALQYQRGCHVRQCATSLVRLKTLRAVKTLRA